MATGIKWDKRDHSWVETYAGFEKLAGPVGDREWGGLALFFGADLEYAGNDLGLASTSAAEISLFVQLTQLICHSMTCREEHTGGAG